MARVENKRPIESYSPDQVCEVWTMSTNTINKVDRAVFDKIEAAKGKIVSSGQNLWSDFEQDNYKLEDFRTGGKRIVYHTNLGSVGPITVMTNSLFDEIKRRNPPNPDIKTKEGQPYERWRKYLATEEEYLKITGQKPAPEPAQNVSNQITPDSVNSEPAPEQPAEPKKRSRKSTQL